MKRVCVVIMVSVALMLGACSQKEEQSKKSSSATSSSQLYSQNEETSASSNSDSSNVSKEEPKNETLHYNGSYYSVTGKYGEVVIVNKRYPLSPDYSPGENAKAQSELLHLITTMQAQGYPVSHQYSGFRSYETQATLYQEYVNRDGKDAADRYSARPGYSEHQTGLAYDLIDTNGSLLTDDKASKWLLEHAADYGFIVRYLEGKENETGYMPESWHLRYIGEEAKEIAASGLTLEEYYGITVGDYVEE